jgi:hypothetical protein
LTALFALSVLTALSALFALAWRFEPTIVVVLLVLMLMLLAIRLLQDLQAKLEADIGFIEQIDIDEMSELVGDLQADKKYYQTNIALAASSLAAKT